MTVGVLGNCNVINGVLVPKTMSVGGEVYSKASNGIDLREVEVERSPDYFLREQLESEAAVRAPRDEHPSATVMTVKEGVEWMNRKMGKTWLDLQIEDAERWGD